jgi:hypothetical protein
VVPPVTDVLARVRATFVTPARAVGPAVRAVTVPSVALLCRPDDVLATGGALALALARDTRARRALVGVWRGPPGIADALRAPAVPEARRLVHALAAHGLVAEASGRLARMVLPDEPEAALAAGARAAAVAAAPTVLALAGARDPVLDRLIAAQDLVVVAPRPDVDSDLASLAVESVAALGVPVMACEPAAGARSRSMAAVGVAASRAVIARLGPVVEAVR